jgi:hypothetical protein
VYFIDGYQEFAPGLISWMLINYPLSDNAS